MSLKPYSGTLGKENAAHLLRRCCYRLDKARIEEFAAYTAPEAVAQLLQSSTPYLDQPIDPETGQKWINPEVDIPTGDSKLKQYVVGWWLDEARRDPTICHKMALFLHNAFTASFEGTGNSLRGFDHLALLKVFALGNLKTLAYKMVVDYNMLRYLNNNVNTKNSPNENFAREFLELFTVMRGNQVGPGDYSNYTEDDIKTAARVLTGFTTADRTSEYLDPDTGIYRGRARFNTHDTSDKTFSARFNHQVIKGAEDEVDMWRELQDFVDMVFGQFETARNYVRRLYRFFCNREISDMVEEYFIAPLAYELFTSDYELQPVLTSLFTSAHFYDADNQFPSTSGGEHLNGALLRAPVDLVLHALNLFHVEAPDPISDGDNHYDRFYRRGIMDDILEQAGMPLFEPPSVAGYPPYYQEPTYHRAWFNSSTIIPRYKLQEMLIDGKRYVNNQTIGTKVDMVAFAENHLSDPSDAQKLVEEILEMAFCQAPDPERFDYFYTEIFLDGLSPINWAFEWDNYLNSGDDTSVRIALNRLFTAVLYSQEFQLM